VADGRPALVVVEVDEDLRRRQAGDAVGPAPQLVRRVVGPDGSPAALVEPDVAPSAGHHGVDTRPGAVREDERGPAVVQLPVGLWPEPRRVAELEGRTDTP